MQPPVPTPATPATTDLARGTRFTTGTVVVDGAGARTVVDLCGYTHPLFAGHGPPPMVPGQLVLALAAGLLESSGLMGADVLALVGMDAVRFQHPLAPGEALAVDVVVRPTAHLAPRPRAAGPRPAGPQRRPRRGVRALHVPAVPAPRPPARPGPRLTLATPDPDSA